MCKFLHILLGYYDLISPLCGICISCTLGFTDLKGLEIIIRHDVRSFERGLDRLVTMYCDPHVVLNPPVGGGLKEDVRFNIFISFYLSGYNNCRGQL
jgi:hypothetical protein